MKIGVIADVHSNQIAFRACVDYMIKAGCEAFLLLGDFVSDTAGAGSVEKAKFRIDHLTVI